MTSAELAAGGLLARDHVDHVGVLEFDGARPTTVYAPDGTCPLLEPAVARPGQHVGEALVAALGSRVARVLGPAWYGYVTAENLLPVDDLSSVRTLSPAHLSALHQLHEETPAAEVAESGTFGLPAYGCFDGISLMAVACLGRWHEMPTIGVLTHPRARRRGLAAKVVTAAARAGLSWREEVQYRAWVVNRASVALAGRCGFVHYCNGLVIELGNEPAEGASAMTAQPTSKPELETAVRQTSSSCSPVPPLAPSAPSSAPSR